MEGGYSYNIIVNDKIVGPGKWHSETATDIPDKFLRMNNGPNYVILETERLTKSIDRIQDK